MDSYQLWDLGIKAAIGAATIGLGFGAWVIAYRQANTARAKLKLDLYEKRFEIYTRIDDLVAKVHRGFVPFKQIEVVERDLRSARFLFDKEVVLWGDSLLVILGRLNESYGALVPTEDRSNHLTPEIRERVIEAIQKEAAVLGKLLDMRDELFMPYLDFRKNL